MKSQIGSNNQSAEELQKEWDTNPRWAGIVMGRTKKQMVLPLKSYNPSLVPSSPNQPTPKKTGKPHDNQLQRDRHSLAADPSPLNSHHLAPTRSSKPHFALFKHRTRNAPSHT
jgi:hypothetical protein